MIQGLYMAASGMMAVEKRHATLANNIANSATPGFRRQQPVQMGFYNVFFGRLRHPASFNFEAVPAGGVQTVETFTDVTPGAFRTTDDPLNLALVGPGYFVLDTPRGERFTRAGAFIVDSDGDLSTALGYKVLDSSGQSIQVGDGDVLIGRDGQVTVGGVVAGVLRLVEFQTPERLLREGNNLYFAPQNVLDASSDAAGTTVSAGQLEMSNVNVATEMIQLMMGYRAYEANQKVIQALDGTMDRLIQRVGMPG